MSNDIKDRSKERRPGIIGKAKSVARDAQSFKQEVQDFTTNIQSGDIGAGSWNTNLYEMLGQNVGDALTGKMPFKSIAKKTLQDFAFAIDLPVKKDVSLGFRTEGIDTPGGPTRDYRFSLTKKF